MIRDDLNNAALYAGLGAGIGSALEYLRATDLAALPLGKHEIRGQDLMAIVQDYETKLAADCFWEAHRKYLDVQFIVRGVERMGYAPLDALRVIQAYDEAKDFMKLDDPRGVGDFMDIRAGAFAIFGPRDAHMPGIAAGAPSSARKVVMKVRVG